MAFLTFFSQSRELNSRRRRRRRLKLLPVLVLSGVTVLTVHALVIFMTIEVPTTTMDAPIPKDLNRVKAVLDESAKTISATAISRTINGWQRIKPSHGGTVYGEFDNFSIGKSCRWQPTSFYHPNKVLSWIFFFSRASFLGKWVCRDCQQGSWEAWNKCPLLHPRGKCPAFDYQGWEEPRPRSISSYDPLSSSPHPVRLITSYGVGKVRKVEYEQPQCLSLRKPCFNMDRCTIPAVDSNGMATRDRKVSTPLPVFAYPGKATTDLKEIILQDSKLRLGDIRIVEDPRIACLLVLHSDDFNAAKESSSWNLGVNHYVYGVSKPISENVHYDMAALGSVAITEAQLRPEYDIPLPLPALWKLTDLDKRTTNIRRQIEELHRPRKYLLTFKGSIQDTLQPYYQHRWLAAEYLYEEPDVVVDVQCKHKTLFGSTVTFAPYDNPGSENFDDLMVNSTFAFCPGGSHVTSYRFTEVLSAGAIPVLLPEIVTPFYPEVDWSSCVIRVSQARIVDLPRVLRTISPEEIRKRQLNCHRLFETFLDVHKHDAGQENGSDELGVSTTAGYLAAALKIWHLRLEKQLHVYKLEHILSSNSHTVADK